MSVGEGVRSFKTGDAVLGAVDTFKQPRPFAEYAVVNESQLCLKPNNLT